MKIAIEASDINGDGAGISYVMRGLVLGALEHKDHTFLVIVRNEADFEEAFADAGGLKLPKHIQLLVRPSIEKLKGGGLAWFRQLGSYLRENQVDILIEPTITLASLYFPRTVQIVNDLSHLRSNKTRYFSRATSYRTKLVLRVIMQRAWQIMTISDTTRKELQKLYPWYDRPVKVLPLGLNKWVTEEVDLEDLQRVRRKYNLPANYLLSVSTLQPRKNFERMIEAFSKLPPEFGNYKYVIVGGKGWYYDTIFAKVTELGLSDKIMFLGYVPDSDMAGLYEQASALAFVSLQEGFGLPLIESAAKALPIVASDIPVFKELKLGDNVKLVNPEDVKDITQAMSEVLKMRKMPPPENFFEQYSWANTMDSIIQGIIIRA